MTEKLHSDDLDDEISSLFIDEDPLEISLWEVAFESLNEADQSVLGCADLSSIPMPSETVQLIEKAKQECEQKQWNLFTNTSGENVKVQDLLGRMIGWVNKFKEVGDAAVQYDPVHAALPWAVVRFFLQMAVNDCETFGSMLEGIEKVSNIVATYTELETRVLLRRSVLTNQLSTALVKLYQAVLRFLAKAYSYYKQRSIKRRLKAALQASKPVTESPVLAIEQQENSVFKLCLLVQNDCMGGSLVDITALLRSSIMQSEKKLEDRRMQLAAWVNSVDTRNTYENALKYRHDGTCEWVLQLNEMKNWRSKDSSKAKLFWLHGPPGFGKTIASSWVIQDLNRIDQNSTAFFFCVAENQLTQDPYAILRAWIAQLLSLNAKVVTIMESAFSQRVTKDQTLSQLELWQLFVLIGQSRLGFTLVVDGFDECTHIDSGTNYHTKDPRNLFLKELVTHLPKTDFRVLVVSRDVTDIREYLETSANNSGGLEMSEYGITAKDTGADVSSFSEDMVKRRLPNKNSNLRDSLAIEAASRSDGMFLWIKLLENEISPGQNASELRQTITEMPARVAEAYSRELERILNLAQRPRLAALTILRWVLFAVRPLQIKELAEALAVSDMPDDATSYPRDKLPDEWDGGRFVDQDYVDETILARCGSLVQVRANDSDELLANRTVHIVHFSAKEYLLSLPDVSHLFGYSGRIQIEEEETRLSHICLRYLTLPIFADFLGDKKTFPFLSYAAWAWYFHSYKKKIQTPAETITRTKRVFHPSTGSWKVWTPVMELKLNDEWKLESNRFTAESEDYTPAETTESSDYSYSEAGEMQENDTNGESTGSSVECTEHLAVQNPLYYASLLGIEEIVQWLEDQGLDCRCGGGLYGFPLQAAVVGNHEAIVKHFINRKIDVNQEGGYFGTALMAAATSSTLEIVKVLMGAGANIFATNHDGNTALHLAAFRGDIDIINILLDAGAPINFKGIGDMTPLHLACYAGHRPVVQLLNSRGADLELPALSHMRAIHVAVQKGHEDLACYIVDVGASVADPQDPSGPPSLLYLAVSWINGTKLIKKLFDNGANVNQNIPGLGTALHGAAARNTPDVLEILINAGGDLRASDDEGVTPIVVAAIYGRVDNIRYLLKHNQGSKETPWGKISPLWIATQHGHQEIIQLLLDSGVTIHYTHEATQSTLFDIALRYSKRDQARFLVERGCFREAGNYINIPNSLACLIFSKDSHTMQQGLVTSPPRYYTKEDLTEALQVASACGSLSMVELLVANGAQVNRKDGNGRTSLHHALSHGHMEIANFLVDKGASLSTEDKIGSTPIDLAVRRGQRSLDFVKQHMTDLSMGINRRPSLLQIKKRGHEAMRPEEIREAIVGDWSGQYEYLSWQRGDQDPMSIHIGDCVDEESNTADQQLEPTNTTALQFSSNKEEVDLVGEFQFHGFVDPIGVIWFVKLYRAFGWLYRGKLDVTTMTLKGTWGSNRLLWHGTFELRKESSLAIVEGEK